MLNYIVKAGGSLQGEPTIPHDKSITHRSVILASIAKGKTKIDGFLLSLDCLATIHAFITMGVEIIKTDNTLTINGKGLYSLKDPMVALNFGNSGTSMRLMAGLLAGQEFDSQLFGDKSLNSRPMDRVAIPLRQMGAKIKCTDNTKPPLYISHSTLKGIKYKLPVPSAQVKSAIILAALYANSETIVEEDILLRDHTENLLRHFSYPVIEDKNKLTIEPGHTLTATEIAIPKDLSSAMFFIVGAVISKNSTLILKDIGINPKRIAGIEILQQMGANIVIENERDICGEKWGDIIVKHSELTGIKIPDNLVAKAIDEIPIILIAAVNATGTTTLANAKELRFKETDRINAMCVGLKQLGVKLQESDDGVVINGSVLKGGVVDSFGDHRIAMSFAIGSLIASSDITIKNCANVATSFPTFAGVAKKAGLQISEFKSA